MICTLILLSIINIFPFYMLDAPFARLQRLINNPDSILRFYTTNLLKNKREGVIRSKKSKL